ncbi:MAG: beta-ketoacyl-[acyl-carrier-protein] synthase family protein [Pseudomonadota bacterium]
MTNKLKNRVVITSTGFFSPLGNSEDIVISSMKNQTSVYTTLEFDQDVIAAPVRDFNVKAFTGRYKNARYLNRGAAFSLASALTAVKGSGLDKEQLSCAGLFTGAGPNMDISNEIKHIDKGKIDPEGLSALWLLRFLPNTPAAMIADILGVHGENFTISTACATGIQTLGEAYRKILGGFLDIALAGSGDSRLNPGGVMAYKMAGALYTGTRSPQTGHRPFDIDRGGFAMGEGGAFFVFEALDHALRRGAHIIAEICGFGSSMDAGSMTAPDPSGKWMEKAVINALKESQLEPGQIDVVSSHGTGTALNDAMEADLLGRVFKNDYPSVIALKSWIGHTSAACGAIELALVLCLMNQKFLPKIVNLERPISPDLNFVTKNKDQAFNTVLLQNFGFGGQNGAFVVKKWKQTDSI